MELERKWDEKLKIEKVNEKLNRNGMEMEWKKKRQIKWKQNLMEWNRNGMEMEWKTWVKYDFVKWI